jgi:hypothetical protein
MKKFNDLVVYICNGVAVPALVLKSQLQADGREFLSLLYADPAIGPDLVIAGATRKVGSTALSVQPLSKGWADLGAFDEEELAAHTAAVQAGEKPPVVDVAEPDLPGIHGLPVQADETDADKAARLANLAHQEPVILPVPSAPEHLDEAQGPVEPDDPNSPHAIEPQPPNTGENPVA